MGKLPAWLKVLIASVLTYCMLLLTGTALYTLTSYMFGVWGIKDYADIALVPRWIRIISENYDCVKLIVPSLPLIALALLLGKAFRAPKVKWGQKSLRGLTLGILTSAAALAALFITGAIRFNFTNPASALSAVFSFAAYAAQSFNLGFVFAWLIPSLLPRAKCRPGIWISAAVYGIMIIYNHTPMQIVNYALVTAICACLYNVWGLGAACLFRLGLETVLFVIMGAYGGFKGIFETYPAAHDWLSGEYSGPMAGFMLTAVLAVVLIILFRVDAGGNNGRLIADKRN